MLVVGMSYLPVLVSLLIALCIASFLLALGFLVSPHKPNRRKSVPYECGFPALSDARIPFDVRFYLVAMVFIVFDIETTLLFPWAVSFRGLSGYAHGVVLLFVTLLVLAFVYEWSRGALDWE